MRVIYFSIAGFLIRIRFYQQREYLWLQKLFIEEFIAYYKVFIIVYPTQKIDYTIDIKGFMDFNMLIQESEKQQYIRLFQQTSDIKITSYYYISGIQLIWLIRSVIQQLLVRCGGCLIHASAVIQNDTAFLFLGKSGAGKSTTAQLLSPHYQVIADDMVILRQKKGKYYIYQLPFAEKNPVSRSRKKYRVGSLYFLHRSSSFKVRQTTNKQMAVKKLLGQLFTEQKNSQKQVEFILKFIASHDRFFDIFISLPHFENVIELLRNEKTA